MFFPIIIFTKNKTQFWGLFSTSHMQMQCHVFLLLLFLSFLLHLSLAGHLQEGPAQGFLPFNFSTLPNSAGEFQGTRSSDLILAVESDDVVLPCHGEPPFDVFAFVLEWSKLKQHSDPNDPQAKMGYVHIYRDGVEVLDEKMPFYINRTSLLGDGLRRGNMSLRISNVMVADGGMYKCFIPTLGNRNLFTLVNLVGELCHVHMSPSSITQINRSFFSPQ